MLLRGAGRVRELVIDVRGEFGEPPAAVLGGDRRRQRQRSGGLLAEPAQRGEDCARVGILEQALGGAPLALARYPITTVASSERCRRENAPSSPAAIASKQGTRIGCGAVEAEVNGATLYCHERGAGPPLVLIHAGLMSSAMWAPMLPDLSDGLRVITPDSRGHGRSNNPDGVLSYAQIADDVAALIAALGLIRPVVGGYSDGGQVALEFGARHPDAAGALIVGAAYPDFAAGGLREGQKAFLGADDSGTPDLGHVDAALGDAADRLKSLHPGGDQQWRDLVQQSASMWLDYEGLSPGEIRRIGAPTLVLTGDRDEQFPLDLMVSLYRALPNAELAVCPHTDHSGPMTPERAGMFAGMIRDFAARRREQ